MHPKFFERLFKNIGVDALHRIAQVVRGHRTRFGNRRANLREHGRIGMIAVHEKFVGFSIRETVKEDRFCGKSIAAAAADFLIITFKRAGKRGVNHRPDVRLIDAHAEGDRGDDDVGRAV